MIYRCCLVLVCIWQTAILSAPLSAENDASSVPTIDEIGGYIERGMKELNVPGAAFAMIENGVITHAKGYGQTGQNEGTVTAQTPFQLASVTKSFTSLVVLQLADEGRVSIDDPVVKHIPYFRTSSSAASRHITLRHLMNHTSGLTTLDGNRYQRTVYRGDDATENAVRQLANARLHSQPGESYQYSNANYATLAHLIETVEGKPFEKVLEARIFSKLDMLNSFVQVPTKQTAPEAKGHRTWFGYPREGHIVAGRMMMGAGGVTASAEDLAKYLIAASTQDSLVTPPALTASWLPENETFYEFGWEHGTLDGKRLIFHDGANPGFRAFIMYDQEADKGALFLMNLSGTHEGSLHHGVVRYALGLPPVDIKPTALFVHILWGSLVGAIVLGLAASFSLWKLVDDARRRRLTASKLTWAYIAIPTAALIGFACILWYAVPRSFGVDFSASSLFYPDIGLLQVSLIIIALVWGGIRSAILIQGRRREVESDTSNDN